MIAEIDLNDISPVLIRCAHFNGFSMPSSAKLEKRYVKNYEIEFFTLSHGGITVDGVYHPMQKGTVHLRRPGQFVQGILPYDCYVLYIDLCPNKNLLDDAISYKNPILDALPLTLMTDKPDYYNNLFSTILHEYIHQKPASQLKIKSLLLQLLYQMYIDSTHRELIEIKGTPYYNIIKKSLSYIEDNITQTIRIAQIAELVGLSPNYFQNIFVKTMGITPNNYIINKRIEKSKELLATSDIPIYLVAQYCGFDRAPYFNYVFKRISGETPKEYRDKYKYYH